MILADFIKVRKYQKEKLNEIFRWLEVLVYSLKGSEI